MDPNALNDPKLKAAVKRIWSEDAAPPELRARVQQLLSDVPAAGAPRWWSGYAIAALLLIAASLATWLPWNFSRDTLAGEALPSDVANSMVLTHDRCCGARDHHLLPGIHGDDYAAIGRRLSRDLGVPVLATALPHWEFEGAGPCPVWGHESAHLLYRDGVRTLSVFSIPARDFKLGSDDDRYAATVNTHQLAGFIRDGGLYCVVVNAPDGQITQTQAAHMRDELLTSFNQDSFVAGSAKLAYAAR